MERSHQPDSKAEGHRSKLTANSHWESKKNDGKGLPNHVSTREKLASRLRPFLGRGSRGLASINSPLNHEVSPRDSLTRSKDSRGLLSIKMALEPV